MKTLKITKENILTFVVSCIIGLLILEIAVRKFNLAPQIFKVGNYYQLSNNPKLLYELQPNSEIREGKINSQGFKDSNFIKEKRKNLVRIAMIGDSITEGSQVIVGKTFSDELERILNSKAADSNRKLKYEVMNFGVGGYNIEAEIETLKVKALQYKPDIVVLNFFKNDAEPISGVGWIFSPRVPLSDEERFQFFRSYYNKANSLIGAFEFRILYRSHLYLFLKSSLCRVVRNNSIMAKFKNKYVDTDIRDEEINFLEQNLKQLESLKGKYGFKLLVCVHSDLFYGESENNDKFIDILKKFNFVYFRMSNYYKKYYRVEFWHPDDLQVNKNDMNHPNVLGHRLIAMAIFNELEKNKFINFRSID